MADLEKSRISIFATTFSCSPQDSCTSGIAAAFFSWSFSAVVVLSLFIYSNIIAYACVAAACILLSGCVARTKSARSITRHSRSLSLSRSLARLLYSSTVLAATTLSTIFSHFKTVISAKRWKPSGCVK